MTISRGLRSVAVMAIAVATSAAGCVRPASGPAVQASLGQEVTLAPRQSVTVEGTNLAVEFLRVTEDSRCPRGTRCVRAGEAKVELLLTMQDRVENAILTTDGEPRSATFGPYTVHLVGLAPVPTTAGAPKAEEYRATLRIEKP